MSDSEDRGMKVENEGTVQVVEETGMSKKGGPDTPEYKAIRSNFYKIVTNFQEVLPRLASQFFGKYLISINEKNYANNTKESEFDI